MNNDIPRDLNSPINTQKINSAHAMNSSVQKISEISADEKPVNNSMAFLGAMGCAQVQMTNPCKKSVETFLKDPEFASSHVQLCDALVERGYSLEEAILKTDSVFSALNNKDTYK